MWHYFCDIFKNFLEPRFQQLVSSRQKILTTCTQDFFLHVLLLFARHTLKKFLRASLSCRFVVPALKYPPHAHRTFFLHVWLLFACHTLKISRALLSCRLVTSRLNIPTTCTQDMCDYSLCDIQKYLTASLSWWLVGSRLKTLTTYTQDFFSFICVYCLRDIPKKFLKTSLSCRLVSSRLKILSTGKQGLFSLHVWLLFAWHTQKNFLSPRFHVG